MEAAIEEVRAELHKMQTRMQLIRLSLGGIGVECDQLTNSHLRHAASRCEAVSHELDTVNDDLTRAVSSISHR